MATTTVPVRDERLRRTPLAKRLMARPELGAVGGAIIVFLFFGIVAAGSGMFTPLGIVTFLDVSAQLGIIAVAAALLMIGGEFDLSLGSMIGFAGIVLAIPAAQWGWPIWLCILVAFAVAVAVGIVNGVIVNRTGLPSFIVTLAGLFILRGLTIGITRGITGRTQISGLKPLSEHDWLAPLFYGTVGRPVFAWMAANGWMTANADGTPLVQGLPASVVWWVVITLHRDLGPAPHPRRQLDLRLRRRRQRGAQRRRAGGEREGRRCSSPPRSPPPSSPACRPWAPARPTCCAAPRRSSRPSSPR